MNGPIDYEVVEVKDGKPLKALVAYDDLIRLIEEASPEPTIPHEVVELVYGAAEMISTKAWRTHLGMTQTQVAKAMDIKQSTYQRIESRGVASLRNSTKEKLAAVFGILPAQLEV